MKFARASNFLSLGLPNRIGGGGNGRRKTGKENGKRAKGKRKNEGEGERGEYQRRCRGSEGSNGGEQQAPSVEGRRWRGGGTTGEFGATVDSISLVRARSPFSYACQSTSGATFLVGDLVGSRPSIVSRSRLCYVLCLVSVSRCVKV